jgi:hypothetical protein
MMRFASVGFVAWLVAAPVVAQSVPTTADLAFMTGCWKFDAKGRVVEEHWMSPSGGSLMGMSRTVVDGETTQYEFLQIRDLSEGLTYIAKPSNQREARFVAKSTSADEVVFENPNHDFPQRIRYRLVGGTALHARVEGTMNGKTRGIDFPFVRANCTP